MQNILEHHKDVEESILSQVLEPTAPRKYFLNQTQLAKFIERASEKKISLPENLRQALDKSLIMLSSTPQSDEKRHQGRRQKATEMTGKHTPSIQGVVPMSYVRRLLPSECERLQGFPEGWTEIDTGQ
ncbi:MAG: DNA cytosine methyltransferase [Treponema sp.]|nr:DNA cytosine methyltransferase [Treponema sp.]